MRNLLMVQIVEIGQVISTNWHVARVVIPNKIIFIHESFDSRFVFLENWAFLSSCLTRFPRFDWFTQEMHLSSISTPYQDEKILALSVGVLDPHCRSREILFQSSVTLVMVKPACSSSNSHTYLTTCLPVDAKTMSHFCSDQSKYSIVFFSSLLDVSMDAKGSIGLPHAYIHQALDTLQFSSIAFARDLTDVTYTCQFLNNYFKFKYKFDVTRGHWPAPQRKPGNRRDNAVQSNQSIQSIDPQALSFSIASSERRPRSFIYLCIINLFLHSFQHVCRRSCPSLCRTLLPSLW